MVEEVTTAPTEERDLLREEIAELNHRLRGEAKHIESLESLLVDAVRERDEARAEAERLREALRAIAAGFDPITGSVDDPSAKQVDGYFRGYATAVLEKAARR